MKKLFAVLAALLLLLAFAALAEETLTSGDFEYRLLENGDAEITKYSGRAIKLDIPYELDGHTVTGIGDWAFANCDSLISVTIPDSVTSIGVNPFSKCGKLIKINVSPENEYLAVTDGVLFSKPDCRLVCYPCAFIQTEYSIPDGIRIIGDWAFCGCSLVSVTIPDSVTSVGEGAFSDCGSLTSITIPDSVTSIGDWAFFYCDFASVTIPDSVTSIGEYAFSKCSLTSVTIPASVTSIGDWAFEGCDLTSVTIPGSVTVIGDGAFSGCSLVSVTIPDSVTSMGGWVFYFCDSLTSVTIPGSVTSMGANPFVWCEKLTKISVSTENEYLEVTDGVLFSIPERRLVCYPCAFTQEEYHIPDGIRIIGDYAFSKCSLTSVTIPASVTSIGEAAFDYCREELVFTVEAGSYAAEYCKENGLAYQYTDALDWLND